ncbi:MAG: MBL fold metallo-hydrolase [Candidatus Xenobia bacterium]
MKIHHLDCVTMCPFGRRFINGDGSPFAFGTLVAHCLLVEGAQGLTLVDTGFGVADMRDMEGRYPLWMRLALNPRRTVASTALHQIEKLGLKKEDVRDIVLTHLDFDHAGGLMDFPEARVHVFATERIAATTRATSLERHRYPPLQLAHRPHWVEYKSEGDTWQGFDSVRVIAPDAGVLLIPLIGHTRGHCGVAVKNGDRWLLHAGDAYFHHHQMDVANPRCPLVLSAFQWLMALDDPLRRKNVTRLRSLVRDHSDQVDVFCAHDPVDFQRLSGRPPGPLN